METYGLKPGSKEFGTHQKLLKQFELEMQKNEKKENIDKRYENIEYNIKGGILTIYDLAKMGLNGMIQNFSNGGLFLIVMFLLIMIPIWILIDKSKNKDNSN